MKKTSSNSPQHGSRQQQFDSRIRFVSDDRSQDQIIADRREGWKAKRISELSQGFTLVSNGRGASIFLRKEDKVLEWAAELAGNPSLDVVVFDDARQWIDIGTLTPSFADDMDVMRARAELVGWLTARGTKFSIGGEIISARKP